MFADRHLGYVGVALVLVAAVATSAAAQTRAVSAPVGAGAGEHAASAPAAAKPLSAASAVIAPSPVVASTADELTRLQDQTMLLQARLKELDAQQAVQTRLQALRGGATPTLDSVRVIAVEQMGATRLATVRLNDGSEFEVAPGDTLLDGTRVTAIENGVVSVRLRGGKAARLRVGAGDAAPEMVSGGAHAVPSRGPTMVSPFQAQPE